MTAAVLQFNPPPKGRADPADTPARAFLEMHLSLNAPGVFMLASFGEDPITGEVLSPKVHPLTDIETSMRVIGDWSNDVHRNIYVSASKLAVPPPPGQRGTESDIAFVTHLVADFDDLDAARYLERMPCAPSWVLETSPGRFQCGIVFSRPLTPDEAKPLARGLKAFCRCDHGTGDIAHVWRIPGLVNWPNKKKAGVGRLPTSVKTVVPWTGQTIDPDLLRAVLPAEVPPPPAMAALTSGPRADWAGPADDDELFGLMLKARQSTAVAFGARCPLDRLLNGDPAVLREFFGGDRSALDAALFSHLAWWTGCDQQRMERLARRTEWVREKWDDRDDYLPRTIQKACNLTTTVYNNRGPSPIVLDGTGEVISPSDLRWMTSCQLSSTGATIPNLANVALGLRTDPALRGMFAFDELAATVVLLRPLVRMNGTIATAGVTPRPLTDADVLALVEWLQLAGINKLAGEIVNNAVTMVAKENAFHPIREYLAGLVWDGLPRVETWLSQYIGAADNAYTRTVGRMFLVAMIARIARPGCQADYSLILEGGQGAQKSSLCRVLAGSEYFSDQLPEITSKDAAAHLRGKWLIEIGELAALSKAETTALKAFMTRREEKFRPAYGRYEVTEPRQCCFIGTTNEGQYLRDSTGNRRFWPVTVGRIDLEALRRDRDQLWAEAVQLHHAGIPWWPDADFERTVIAPEQDARLDADPWESVVVDYLQRHTEPTTIAAIATTVLGVPTGKIGTVEQRRIRGILQSLKWTQARTKAARLWHPPPPQ